MTLIFAKVNRVWLVAVVLLVTLNIWFFWPGDLYFLNDDLLHIPLTSQNKFFQTNSVRPIHELLVRLDISLYGKHANGYHITALLLHLLVCLQLFNLTFVIQTRWLNTPTPVAVNASFFAIVLFLIYPQHVESFAWILGRTPILSAIFLLMSLRIFFSNNIRWLTCLLGALSFAAALFTYEQCILYPLVLPIALSTSDRKRRLAQLRYIVGLFLTAILYIVARKAITSDLVGNYEGNNFLRMDVFALGGNFFRLMTRLFLNPSATAFYFVSLSVFVLLTILISIPIRKLRYNKRAVVFVLLSIVLLVLPVLSLGISIHSFESGRYLYLPSIFLIAGLSIGAVHLYQLNSELRKTYFILFVGVVAYWLYGKYSSSYQYKDASVYAMKTHQQVFTHFSRSSDTLHIDTLKLSIHRLPVFRLGFKTGIKWLNNAIDTNKIIVDQTVDNIK